MNIKPVRTARTISALLLVLAGTAVSAQTRIELDQAELNALGIITRPVSAADNSQGLRVSAEIITSPLHAAGLVALYDGTVERWLVDGGAQVRAGTALVAIQSPDTLALQRDWMEAKTRKEQARFDLDKDRQLFDDGVISRRRLEETERNFSQAGFVADSAGEALRAAGFDDQALASLAGSGTGMGLYMIRARADGVLSHRMLEAGETVTAGEAVGRLTLSGPVWVEAEVPVSWVHTLQTGQKLSLATGEALVIRMKDSAVDGTSQTFTIHGELESVSDHVPGQVVSVILSDAREGVWVPASAVVHNNHDTTLYVTVPGGIEPRTLLLAPSGAGYVATSGLVAGDLVVVQGAAILKGIELGLGGDE